MDYRDETESEHRARDDKTWDTLGLLALFFPGFRPWMLLLILLAGCAWLINVLGESTVLNSPDIVYVGRDPRTGETVAVKGCRPERVLPDGKCDKSITWDSAKKAFPYFGEPRKVPATP